MPLHVIVVGCGIAGLCAAAAFRQAGHQVDIYEKSALKTETGAALVLAPNGFRVLKQLGFSPERARACMLKGITTLRGTDLQPLGNIQRNAERARAGLFTWSVHRVDLHTELLRVATGKEDDLSGPPARLFLSSAVVGISGEGTIRLADGSKFKADLIVGADGVHSALRPNVLPGLKEAPFSGSAAFRFLLETETISQDPDLQALLTAGDEMVQMVVDAEKKDGERHIMCYGCRSGTVMNFVGIHPASADVVAEDQDKSSAETAEMMRQEFGHFDKRLDKIIAMSSHVKRWPLFLHSPLPTWSRGKVILIGDAAHPMLPFGGQGANQAIEDGAALGRLFPDFDSQEQFDIEARLAMFEKLRKNRASRVQILSSVRAGLEKQVEGQVSRYSEDGIKVPSCHKERIEHDYGYDVLGECAKLLGVRR